MKVYKNNGKEGAVLLLVLIMVLLMSILGLGLMRQAGNNAVEASQELNRTRAFWLAEAGLQELQAILGKWENRTPLHNISLVGVGVLSGVGSEGSYRVDISDYTGGGGINLGSSIKRYVVSSTGTVTSGTSVTLLFHVRTGTFANYIFASHDERGIRFTTGDKIVGDVYSNDQLQINGKPVFEGMVWSASDTVNYTDERDQTSTDTDVFTQGLELGAVELDFGQYGSDPLENLQFGASLQLLLTESSEFDIEFLGNSYRYKPRSDTVWVDTNLFVSGEIIYVEGNVYVEGRVGGSISVVSEETIHITGDIVYASSPHNNYSDSSWENFTPAEGEVLGLFSKEAIEVAPQGIGVDINIHAAIFITESADSVETGNPGFGTQNRYNDLRSGGERPKINLLGSISQYQRGVVGSGGRSGFSKNYGYDPRLRDAPPPGMPYSAYEFSNWEQL